MRPTWIGSRNLAVLLTMAIVGISGCSSKNLRYEGRIATQQDNISLQAGGPHKGQWKGGDVIVNYTYSNQAGSIQIEGTVELTRRITNTFRIVTNLSVRANLMDNERTILVSQPLFFVGNTSIRDFRFNREITVPPEARTMNFSYNGSAAENGPFGGRDQVTTTFWQEP